MFLGKLVSKLSSSGFVGESMASSVLISLLAQPSSLQLTRFEIVFDFWRGIV